MKTRRTLTGTLLALLLLALMVGPGRAQAPEPRDDVSSQAALGTAFTYQGRLSDGGEPAEGSYDVRFRLYDAATGGTQVGSAVTRSDVDVSDGLFAVQLDFGSVFDGTALWLDVGVRPGSSTASYTALSPRQALTAAPYALYAADVASHDHWGESWSGSGTGLTLEGDTTALLALGSDRGVWGVSHDTAGTGVVGEATADSGETYGVIGGSNSTQGVGVRGTATATTGQTYGVYGLSYSRVGTGVYGEAAAADGYGYGVHGVARGDSVGVIGEATASGGAGVWGLASAESGNNYGVVGENHSPQGVGVYGQGGTGVSAYSYLGTGLYAYSSGGTKDNPALAASNSNMSNGMAAYLRNTSSYHTAHVENDGTGGVLFLQNAGDAAGSGGGDFITAVNNEGSDTQFQVTSSGAAYSDGGWNGAADFAELMTTEGDPAAYEPGDVLVVSVEADRTAVLSSQPYSSLVLGIYSENPGFVGSTHPMEDQRDDEIPVAVVGIVPCKISAENGAVHRGDLLVTSSTPGHAMRADDAPAGTILGKALEPLDQGTGTIQVLVTLQ